MSTTRDDSSPGHPEDPNKSEPRFEIPEPPPPERRVGIGVVVKAHGLKGDLKVQTATWRPERFADLDAIWLEGKDGRIHWLTVKRMRFEPGAVYIRFNEAPVREYAEPLIGGQLFVDVDDRAELPDDLYYVDDLVGCHVTCTEHGDLGTITDVMDLPANDVWQVNGPLGEVLIPAIQEVVISVDTEAKQIQVTLLEGLLPEQQKESDSSDPEIRGSGRGSTRSRHKIKRPERPDDKLKPPDDH
jgi:16S rRNA processing protein RimM